MKRINRKTIIGGSLLVLIVIAAGCSLLARKNQSSESVQISTIAAARGSIDQTIELVGNSEYKQSSVLSWETEGVIENVNVSLGDKVRKGDVLASLAVDSMASSLIIAEKTMIDAQDNLTDVQESTTARMQAYQALNSAETALQTAKREQEVLYYPRSDQQDKEFAYDDYMASVIEFNWAKRDFDSVRGLEWDAEGKPFYEDYANNYQTMVSAYEEWMWLKGVPDDLDYIVANGKVEAAQVSYDNALEEYQSYATMPREKDVLSAELQLTSATSAYNKRNILAPFDGVVTSLVAQSGYHVTKGTVALQVDDMSRMFVPVNVSEIDFSKVYIGQKAEVTFDANSGHVYQAQVSAISDLGESSDAVTSFLTTVEITEPDESIKAGMTAEVKIILDTHQDVLLVPINGVTSEDGRNYVTILKDNVQHKTAVSLGLTNSYVAEVTAGNVAEGDEIVVSTADAAVLSAMAVDQTDLQRMDQAVQNRSLEEVPLDEPPAGMKHDAQNKTQSQPDQSAAQASE